MKCHASGSTRPWPRGLPRERRLKDEVTLTRRTFRDVQRHFTAYVREPTVNPPPEDVAERRIAVYASLIFKNLNAMLISCFPALHGVLAAARWEGMVRDFLAHHRAQTPLFSRIPGEFLRYLAERQIANDDPGFLRELAHYEWLELDVSYDPRDLAEAVLDLCADPYHHIPVLNPLARPVAYAYPVHRIGPDYIPDSPPLDATHLVVFRDRDDGVAFIQLTPVTARLVEMIQNNSAQTGEALLTELSEEIGHPQPEVLLDQGHEILRDLQQRQLVLGARFASAAQRDC